MSSVFLFGAGASFGSENCYPEPPPLGNGPNGLFKKLQKRGGFASSVASPLADLFINNFEEGMAEFYSTHKRQTSAFLREMSLYFSVFEPLEGNLYRELIRAIASTKHQVVFATTNYDLLIEHSIRQLGYKVSYCALPVPRNNYSVLKIHCSCNFLPDLGGFSLRGVYIDTTNASAVESSIKPAYPSEVIKFCNEEDSLAPAIAMYAKGKEVKFCSNFVLEQQKFWRESVYKAKKIFVIGLRVHVEDTHIWQVLATSKAQLLYIGGNKEDDKGKEHDFDRWKRENGRKNAHWIAERFNESIPIIKKHFK